MKVSTDVTNALNKAKFGLMMKSNSAFITSILWSLKFKWNESIPTACTNGISLLINPQFFMDHTHQERVFLLAHEAWHVAFNHMGRLNGRNMERWNKAADFVINNMLRDNGFQIINGALLDSQYHNMSAEQVYELLEDDDRDNPMPDISDSDLGDSSGEGDIVDQINSNVTDILAKARQVSKMEGDAAGTIPNDVDVMIDELVNPKLPWNVIFQDHANKLKKDEYSYKRPNRRAQPDYFMPTRWSMGLGYVSVAVDTSGSVTDEEFTMFLSEIEDFRQSLQPELTTIIDFDTRINNVHKLSEFDSIQKVNFTGRGGTDLQPVFDYYTDEDPPEVLVVFSDLCCNPIEEEPPFPVIWICINNPHAEVNFGQLIHMDTNTKVN